VVQAPSSSDQSKVGNRILDALSFEARAILRPHFETIPLTANESIQEPGAPAKYSYFPVSGMISVLATMADGGQIETGIAGNEGMFGVSTVLGDDAPSQKAIVQLAGSAIRIGSAQLRKAADANAELRGLLMRYAQAMLVGAMQSAACNRLHLLEQRCARWLLTAHDRAGRDRFAMTHEYLATMLGVRRAGVTVALQVYRDGGMITYNHGTMTVLDRAALETSSCECYRFIKGEFERLLGGA